MNALGRVGSFFDNLISIFNPGRALLRSVARKKRERIMERYAAGKHYNSTHGWAVTRKNINDEIASDGPLVRDRVKALCKDFPYFKRAKSKWVDLAIGTGMTLQAKPLVKNKKRRKNIADQIEKKWKRFCKKKNCDIEGKSSLHELARICFNHDFESGEALLRIHITSDSKNPLKLQVIDPEWLTSFYGVKPRNEGAKVEYGIEYHKDTGKVFGYHLTDPDNYENSFYVPAELMIHIFKKEHAGQQRGISMMSSAVLIAHDLRERIETELEVSKVASKVMGFVTSDKLSELQESYGDEDESEDDATGDKLETIVAGTVKYLKKGESMQFANFDRPGAQFETFVNIIIRMIAVTCDLSFELISGNYDRISYSNLRGIRQDMKEGFKPIHKRVIDQFYQAIFEKWLMYNCTLGILNLPDYQNDPEKYEEVSWSLSDPPEFVDPIKEVKARSQQYSDGVRTRKDDLAAQGVDWDEHKAQVEEEAQWVEKCGLNKKGGGNSSTNPAVLEEENNA